MGVGAGLYMYVVVVRKFTFAISSPDEFLYGFRNTRRSIDHISDPRVKYGEIRNQLRM